MKLTAADIEVLSREVTALAAGGQVQKIRDGRPGEVIIAMRSPGTTHRLLLAAGSTAARVHLVFRSEIVRSRSAQGPTGFVRLLRKHLMGGRLVGAESVPSDRVCKLDFHRREAPAESGTPDLRSTSILAELTGRHGNLFLLDDHGRILGSLRANISHRRKLVVGEPYVYPTLPASGLAAGSSELVASLIGDASRQVDDAFEALLSQAALDNLRTQLRRGVRRSIKRLTRRLRYIGQDQQRADNAEQYRRWGELLQSAYGKIDRGAEKAVVPDFYDPELTPAEIPLDPALSLSENIQRYFKEAKRFKAAREQIVSRRDQTETELRELETARTRIEEATSIEALDELAEQLQQRRLIAKPQAPPGRARKPKPFALPYHTFTSSTGKTILVGRGARQNDQLTFRVARGRDLWLHVDGAAGAHVIVVLEKGQTADGETLVEAATLAAHYSERRRSTSADVRYAPQSRVRKHKGAPPGQVTVSPSKTIHVRLDPERLRRLFDSRKELLNH